MNVSVGVTHLLPNDNWDRLQPPCNPKLNKWLRKWMVFLFY